MKINRFILLGLVLLVGASVAAWVLLSGGRFIETDNAYVKAVRIQISPEISGKVAAVLFEENQLVEKGAELFRIDDEPLRIALAKADAELALIRDQIDAMRASLRQNAEEQKREAANAEFAEPEFKRQSSLVASRVAAEARLYKIDTTSLQVVNTYAGLSGPYTYSDMTGWGLQNNICNPEG